MKKVLFTLTLLAALAVAGCGGEEKSSGPASAPKAAPAAAVSSKDPVMVTGSELAKAKDAWKKKGMGDLESVAKYPDGTIIETFSHSQIITHPDGTKTYKGRDDKKIDLTKGDGTGIHHFPTN